MIRIRSHAPALPLLGVAIAAVLGAVLSAPAPAHAQVPPGFDPAQMEKMMKQFQDPAAMKKLEAQMKKTQQCLEDVDDAQIQALRRRAEQAEAEIERLCAQGKEAQARKRAIEIGRELQGDATVKKLSECSAGMQKALPDMPWTELTARAERSQGEGPAADDGNLCD